MSKLSDKELIKSILSGNQDHAGLIFNRYKNYVSRIAFNMVNDQQATQDLVQEVFIKVFKSLKSFEGKSTFKTWLTRIAVNTCKNYRVKKSVRQEKFNVYIDENSDEEKPPVQLEGNSQNPDQELRQKEIKIVVNAAIELLSDKHKEVVVLNNEGLTYKEISEILQIPEKSVGSRLYYAREQLKKILTPYVKGNGS